MRTSDLASVPGLGDCRRPGASVPAGDCGDRTIVHRLGIGHARRTTRWNGLAFGTFRDSPVRVGYERCPLVEEQTETPFLPTRFVVAPVQESRLTNRSKRTIVLTGNPPTKTTSNKVRTIAERLTWKLTLRRVRTVLTECDARGACRKRSLRP